MGFILILIIFLIFGPLLEKMVHKILHVDKRKISETPGKHIERWGRVIIGVIYFCICCLTFAMNENYTMVMWFWVSFITLFLGFHSFLEWKYLKNSKQYASTLIILGVSDVIIFIMSFSLR